MLTSTQKPLAALADSCEICFSIIEEVNFSVRSTLQEHKALMSSVCRFILWKQPLSFLIYTRMTYKKHSSATPCFLLRGLCILLPVKQSGRTGSNVSTAAVEIPVRTDTNNVRLTYLGLVLLSTDTFSCTQGSSNEGVVTPWTSRHFVSSWQRKTNNLLHRQPLAKWDCREPRGTHALQTRWENMLTPQC